jgi:hypothetical protein
MGVWRPSDACWSIPAPLSLSTTWGNTALSWACRKGYARVMRALLEKGADPSIANNIGKTPMATAKLYKQHACIEAPKVSCSLHPLSPSSLLTGLTEVWGLVHGVAGRRRR